MTASSPALSRRKGWTDAARVRRKELARSMPRGSLPEIVVAEKFGRETALTRPTAVVLDLHAACLRRGLDRTHLVGRVTPRIVIWALRHLVDEDMLRAEMIAAVWPDRDPPASGTVAHSIGHANATLRPVGLEITSLWGGTVRLAAIERSSS